MIVISLCMAVTFVTCPNTVHNTCNMNCTTVLDVVCKQMSMWFSLSIHLCLCDPYDDAIMTLLTVCELYQFLFNMCSIVCMAGSTGLHEKGERTATSKKVVSLQLIVDCNQPHLSYVTCM